MSAFEDSAVEDLALPSEVEGYTKRRVELVQKAVKEWRGALVDLGGRNNLLHYRDLKRGTLDVTAANPAALEGLLRGKATKPSSLFDDPQEREKQLARIRTIHNKAKENLEERGLATLSLACGLASWENKRGTWQPCAPVLLQRATLRALGAAQDEFELALVEDMEVNPLLLHLLKADFECELVGSPATFAGLGSEGWGRWWRSPVVEIAIRPGGAMAVRVQLREITNEEGNRLLRIVRRTSGSVVTWRRAQIVLLSAQGMSPPRISEVVFTDPDTVRDVIHNFNADGFDALYPRYRGGRPQTFTLPKRQEIKRIALSDPQDLDQPFATWSLSKLADYLVAEGVVTDISHEGLRQLLREENVRFQAVRTWKRSNDPAFKAKHDRIVELYELAEAGQAIVICLDEFGPLNLQPQPGGRGWAPRAKPKRIRATYKRPHGVRHLISAYDVSADRLYGHIKKRKDRPHFLEFCRYIRSLYPAKTRLHFILDNFSPHHGKKMREWATRNNVELAYTPHYASWLNRIEAQFRALRYFTLAGTDHPDHATQARLIRRYIHWRNRNTDNPRLKRLINTANVA